MGSRWPDEGVCPHQRAPRRPRWGAGGDFRQGDASRRPEAFVESPVAPPATSTSHAAHGRDNDIRRAISRLERWRDDSKPNSASFEFFTFQIFERCPGPTKRPPNSRSSRNIRRRPASVVAKTISMVFTVPNTRQGANAGWFRSHRECCKMEVVAKGKAVRYGCSTSPLRRQRDDGAQMPQPNSLI